MSRRMKRMLTCPKCGKEHEFVIWDSINTMLDPEMKEAVRNLSAFQFECPDCGNTASVDYGFLYHQMEDKTMIYYVQSDEDEQRMYDLFNGTGDVDGMVSDMRNDNYLIRIVRSRSELLEKLAIFDNNLDDRVVEFLKLIFLAQYQDQTGDDEPIVLYWVVSEDGKYRVEFIKEGKLEATVDIPEDLYQSTLNNMKEKIPDLRKDDIIIDRQWALEFLEKDAKSQE